MDFEIFINNSSFVAGNTFGVIFFLIIAAGLLYLVIRRIRNRFKQGETLKYEFITIIAHKFRTPLSSCKWLLEEMSSEASDPRTQESLFQMKQMNEKLISLTGTLIEMTNLDSETKDSYNFEKVSLCEFVQTVSISQKASFQQKNISFSNKCLDETVVVSIDRPRFEFVLQTVLENACIYTRAGLKVDISAGRNGNKAVIAVADMGIGIDPNDIGNIFTKFFRTENAKMIDTEGFGIGLYLAKSIVARHGGKISVFSEGLNRGSTFVIELPLARA